LAKKPNYNFEKRKKELDRKAKRDAKLQRKRENAERPPEEPAPSTDPRAIPPE
jgi:hypothetical protein